MIDDKLFNNTLV